MVGSLFLLIIFVGILILLRSFNKVMPLATRYTGIILPVGLVTYLLATLFVETFREARGNHRIGTVVIEQIFDRDNFWLQELNLDDFDPQIQNALAAIQNETKPELSTEELLKILTPVVNPSAGSCGVCYDTMLTGKLLSCPECHKLAHRDCLKEWFVSGQKRCIYCRYNLAK